MPKATKKAGGLFRRLSWQRLPWFWKLLPAFFVLSAAMGVSLRRS